MKKNFQFAKMSGAGNDFLVFNNMSKNIMLNAKERAAVCRRGFSVGADGILFIQASKRKNCHFRMRYFNSDGREAEMCGNGARCAARFAFDNGIAPRKLTFQSKAGTHNAEVLAKGLVRLQMTKATHFRQKFMVKCLKKNWTGGFVNTGVPHFVLEVKNLDKIDIANVAPHLRHHSAFGPSGSNINFVELSTGKSIRIRTFERGVEGETLACGTGAVAAALWIACKHNQSSPIAVKTRGGALKVIFRRQGSEFTDVVLEGPTSTILIGKLGNDAFI